MLGSVKHTKCIVLKKRRKLLSELPTISFAVEIKNGRILSSSHYEIPF